MAKKSKKIRLGWQCYASLFVVFLIVIGATSLSVLASRNQTSASQDVGHASTSVVPPKGPAFLVMDGNNLKLISLDGSRRIDIKWPDDVSRLGQPLSQVQGVDSASGQPVWLDSGFVRASSTIWRSPDGRRNARLASDKRDGAGTIEINQGQESRILVLRQKNGRKITDEQLLGWVDKDTMVLVGVATGTRNIFTLDLNGVLTPLAQLPDDVWFIKVADNAVYYTRATPGEGLESPQQAPSSLWRVDVSGQSLKLVEESLHVIQNMIVGDGALIYVLENQKIKKFESGKISDSGVGRPLMRAAQSTLYARAGELFLLKDGGGEVLFNGIQSEGAIFYLPEASLK